MVLDIAVSTQNSAVNVAYDLHFRRRKGSFARDIISLPDRPYHVVPLVGED